MIFPKRNDDMGWAAFFGYITLVAALTMAGLFVYLAVTGK